MTAQLVYRPEAVEDIAAAYDWYECERPGLGLEFRAALAGAEQLLAAMPDAFPVVYRYLRRILLRRFPYSVYSILTSDGVQVWACIHQARHPGNWHSRGQAG